jgi:hypothetical protein
MVDDGFWLRYELEDEFFQIWKDKCVSFFYRKIDFFKLILYFYITYYYNYVVFFIWSEQFFYFIFYIQYYYGFIAFFYIKSCNSLL